MKLARIICRVMFSVCAFGASAAPDLEPVYLAPGQDAQPLVDAGFLVDFSTTSFGASRNTARREATGRGSVWNDSTFVRMEKLEDEPLLARFLDASIPDLVRYTEALPDDVNAWTVLGVRWYQTNQVDDALAALELARKLDPGHERSAELFSAILIHAGNPIRAEREVRKLLDEMPHNRTLRFNAACGYALWDKPDEAVYHLRMLARMGWADLRFYLNDPDLVALEKAPDFEELVEELDRTARGRIVDALRRPGAWLDQP